MQHLSWHRRALQPGQAPASPASPCDIYKEAFARENISFSSLKAGWCPSNRLVLGPAAPARPAPPMASCGPALVHLRRSLTPQGARMPTSPALALGPLPKILGQNHPPQRGPERAGGNNSFWKQQCGTAGQIRRGTGQARAMCRLRSSLGSHPTGFSWGSNRL